MQTKSTEIVRKIQHEYTMHADELVELLGMHGELDSLSFNEGTGEVVVKTLEEQALAEEKPDLWFRTVEHISSDGRVVQLQDMSYRHLVNCYNKYGNEAYHLELMFRNA